MNTDIIDINSILTPEIMEQMRSLSSLNRMINKYDDKYRGTDEYISVSDMVNRIYEGIFTVLNGVSDLVAYEFEKKAFWEVESKKTA